MSINSPSQQSLKPMADGVLAGCICTVLFNPVDRALFLRIKYQRSIWDSSLWAHSYQGASKALCGRIVSYGVYFSFYDYYSDYFKTKTEHSILSASLSTGLSTVVLSHAFNFFKNYQWSHEDPSRPQTTLQALRDLVREHGPKIFFRGFYATAARDCLFAALYFSLSNRYNPDKKFGQNLAIASTATLITSPLNYFRNRQFFDFQESTPTLRQVSHELRLEILARETLYRKITYVTSDRFNMGLGALRIGLGIAIADKIYNLLKSWDYLDYLKFNAKSS